MGLQNQERALISKIVETGEMEHCLKSRITLDHFEGLDNREVFGWLALKYEKRGQVPSKKLLRIEFPDYKLVKTKDNLGLLIDVVREAKLYREIQRALANVSNEAKTATPKEALELLQESVAELSLHHADSEVWDFTNAGEEILADYEENKKTEGMKGIPWMWSRVNKATGGKRKEQLITIYGRTGVKKTFLLLADAEFSHRVWGQIPLFLTREMTYKEILERWAALRIQADFDAYQKGKLDEDKIAELQAMVKELEEDPPFHTGAINSYGMAAVAEIRALAKAHKVTCIYIDGLYLYQDGHDYKAFHQIVRRVKDLARELQLPILVTSQANSEKEQSETGNTKDVAFGQALAQFSDVLIRVVIEKQHHDEKEAVLKSKKVRSGKPFVMTINAIPCTDFSQKYTEENEEELNAEIGDDGGL